MPTKRIRKTGLPPGSLIFTGIKKSDQVLKKLICYNADRYEEIDPDVPPVTEPGLYRWLDIRGIHNAQVIEAIGKTHSLDPLLLEDILDTEQRPKCEMTDSGIFIILKLLKKAENKQGFISEQISIVVTSDRVITFQEDPDDSFAALRERMQRPDSRLRTRKPDYLLYRIIDFISDHFFPVIDHCIERIDLLDEAINRNPDESMKKSIFQVRRDIAEVHRIAMPTREVVNSLLRMEPNLVSEKTRRYLRDVMDNIMQVIDLNDNQRDHLASLHDLFMSDMTYRMTNVMKILTVVTSIFIPLTFLTSVYGMNFKYQDEYNWPWAYPVLWIIMIIIALIQVVYFRRKKWL